MGIYSSFIGRKFKHIAGKKYEDIIKHYREFLLTEEEKMLPEIRSILMPLDRYVKNIPDEVYETVSAYDASVLLVYIMDSEIFHLLSQTLSKEASEEFKRREEIVGREMLDKIAKELEDFGLRVQRRIFFGNKSEDIIRLAENSDMLVISRAYGSEITKTSPLSPIVLKIIQHLKIPAVVY
ncbi:universal stress protein [Thermococcus argininiproducens]|uniref:Universal stress protein n=1 Tax=Thermococcus argininiproducens TaxID=2866384 RepID=A0A9E7MAG7_9EURY|nr:universal stress protein [Thermococcus argininiproducens]USG99676.1 universal stress protein [Thermococcus argininiproducens]